MNNMDPRFRSAIADLEKASTGQDLRNALVDPRFATRNEYDHTANEPSDDDIAPEEATELSGTGGTKKNKNIEIRMDHYNGALPILEASHTQNLKNIDPTFFIDPVIGPGDTLIDFNPDYDLIDQDGNPVKI